MCEFPSYYCNTSFVDVVLPFSQIKVDESKKWLIIGHPGVDGIEFRIRNDKQTTTVYAYYPIEGEFIEIAESVDDLINKWKNDRISL